MIPTISLIVLSYNNWAFTDSCLTTLMRSFDESLLERGIEVIVVDNGSTKETRQSIEEFAKEFAGEFVEESARYATRSGKLSGGASEELAGPHTSGRVQLRMVMLEENLGYPCGINAGLEHCRGSFIGVLNNDLVFPFGWLTSLIQLLETDKLVGFAAPYLSFAPSVQHVDKTLSSLEEMQAFAAEFTTSNAGKLIYTDRVIGACVLFRRDLLETIGGNDFWYGIGNYDDTDWCMRARIAGYKVAVVGRSFVQHIGHASFKLEPALFNSSLKVNAEKFERKWDIPRPAVTADPNILIETANLIKFDRGRHYIPFRIGDYSSAETPLYPRNSQIRRWLLCADWVSEQSSWSNTLLALLLETEQTELSFWVPGTLFDVTLVVSRIQRLVAQSHVNVVTKGISFTIFQDNIPYVDIPRLIASSDAVVQVPRDFVNGYFLRLAGQIGVGVQTVVEPRE